MFFVLCFFAFTSLTTVDLFQMERKMVMREVRGAPRADAGLASFCIGLAGLVPPARPRPTTAS